MGRRAASRRMETLPMPVHFAPSRSALTTLLALCLTLGSLGCGHHEDPPDPGPPTITIGPGFTPQPTLAIGSNRGGFVNALDFGGDHCRGMLPREPQHVLVVTADLPMLSVVVRGQGSDPTLVIRPPTGRALCNDDSEGRDPAIRAPFPAGRYEIYVGAYDRSPQDDYRLGLSEAELQPSAIPFAP